MKTSRLFFVLAFLVSGLFTILEAQDEDGYHLRSLTMASGEDAITSGISGIARFASKDHGYVEFAVQAEQAWGIYGYTFEKKDTYSLLVSGSIGHLQGAPWIGPLASLDVPFSVGSVPVSLNLFDWPCLFTKKPKGADDGKPATKPLIGHLASTRLDAGPFFISFAYFKYLFEPVNYLTGGGVTVKVTNYISIAGSGTWNQNANKWMLWMGMTIGT